MFADGLTPDGPSTTISAREMSIALTARLRALTLARSRRECIAAALPPGQRNLKDTEACTVTDPGKMDRRTFLTNSLAASAGASLAIGGRKVSASAKRDAGAPSNADMPCGQIGDVTVSRLLLGGNLLTHYTHSRDLQYVYNLAAHYNTLEKTMETMALAEKHGVNTLTIHHARDVGFPGHGRIDILDVLKKYRRERGGDIQWIICPTAPCKPGMEEYAAEVEELADAGAEALYLWGVRADQLYREGKIDLMKQAVAMARAAGVPSGVGAHDLRVVEACEEHGVDPDFYIKTFHHHNYPTAPQDGEINGAYSEIPGYWCKDPERTVKVMNEVDKPWIAFKVMAAGAIPPKNAFPYVVNHGADHVLAGMFDYEIAEDAKLARRAVADADRERPWRS